MSENVIPLQPALPGISPGLFRQLPYNVEAEKAVLGSIFLDNKVFDSLGLTAEHFAYGPNARVFEECGKLISVGKIADPVTLKLVFETDQTLTDVGGAEYLAELAASGVGSITAIEYARLIADLAHKRELINIGEELVESSYTSAPATTAFDLREITERRLSEIAQPDDHQADDTLEFLEARYANPNSLMGVSTGLTALDSLLCGFQPAQLVLLAARPSMGKTTLACCMARKSRVPVAFFSLEQPAREIRMKLISDMADVPLEFMRKGKYRDERQWQRVVDAAQELERLPIHIIDISAPSAGAIRGKLREMVRKHGIQLAIIDQLGHIQPPKSKDTLSNQLDITTKSLKAVAMVLGIPIILLHQLNRGVESRDNKRPALHDLRDSGGIEQNADVVLFIYREAYYLERSIPEAPSPGEMDEKDFDKAVAKRCAAEKRLERLENTAEIICAKQRMGPIDTINLNYHGGYSRFCDPVWGSG